MSQLFTNNAKTRLTADLGTTATSFNVTSGDGALFPSVALNTPDYFLVTFENSSGDKEIVKIVERSGDSFTIGEIDVVAGGYADVLGRGREGTTIRGFSAADRCELRLTAGFIDAIKRGSITFLIDGVGFEITTGVKGFIEVPFNGSIEAARAFADIDGSISVNIYKSTYAEYPWTSPADDAQEITDSIGGHEIKIIADGSLKSSNDLTGWVRTFQEGDILIFEVTAASIITKCTISLTVDRNAI